MKIYKYIGLSFLTLALAGCQSEEVVGGQQQEGVFTLRANMQGYSHDSRAQIQLGNQDAEGGEIFYWNAGDKFTLIEKIVNDDEPEVTITPKLHEFTISDTYSNDSPYSSADFTSPTALTYLSDFVAFYPAVSEDEYGYDFYIDNKLKDNTAESWNSYFKNNMFMKATGISVPSDQMGLNFQQMCSLIRITYTNATDTDREIKKISVDGSWGSGFHVDKNSLECGASSGYGGDYGVEFTDGATIAAGESEDFYILYYPYRQYNSVTSSEDLQLMETIFVTLENDQKLRTENYPFGDERPDFFNGTGKRFWFNVTETADGLKWTKFLNEEPGGDEPGEDEEEDDTVYPTVPEGSFLIKDKGFSQALYDILNKQNGQFIQMVDGYAIIDMDFANNYQGELNIKEGNYQIETLSGIENFTMLRRLWAPNLGLKECDLSHNTNLYYVGLPNYSSDKKMASIKLGNNSRLTNLNVSGNSLTQLDLSGVPNLSFLYCSDNMNLNSLTLSSKCMNLQTLSIGFTALTSLSIPYPAAIRELDISDTNISINWDGFSILERLDCTMKNASFINSIPNRIKENLEFFVCGDCELTSLNLFPFKSLKDLMCPGNQLTTLDLSHLTELERLDCGHNRLNYLDLSATNSLVDLTCGYQTNGQKDENGEPVYIPLTLVLSTAMQERWNNEWTDDENRTHKAWKDAWSHKDEQGKALVILDTTGNTGGNSVGGSDFTYGDNNIW